MHEAGRLTKIGALCSAVVIFSAVLNCNSANAQSRSIGNSRQLSSGSLPGRPGVVQNRGRVGFANHGVGNFGYFRGSFRELPGFRAGRGRHDFGPNIVILPSIGAPPPAYYDASPPYPGSLSCFNGWEPSVC